MLSQAEQQRFLQGVAWVVANQRRDGSWGRTKVEKITFTAHAIQLLQAMGYSRDTSTALRRAVGWLEAHVRPGEPHWYTRIEIGLRLGQGHELLNNGYLGTFIDELDYDLDHPDETDRLDFFWHVLPTLVAMRSSPTTEALLHVPHDRVIERLATFTTSFRDDCATVLHSPNHTGLAAMYCHCISSDVDAAATMAKSFVNWLLESKSSDSSSRLASNDTSLHWHYSRSITAYVLIDLLAVSASQLTDADIHSIVRYLLPNDHGQVLADAHLTFQTELHRTNFYSTVLSLRAIVAAQRSTRPDYLPELRTLVESTYRARPIPTRAATTISQHSHRIPVAASGAVTASGGVLLLFPSTAAAGAWIFFTGCGGLLGILAGRGAKQ